MDEFSFKFRDVISVFRTYKKKNIPLTPLRRSSFTKFLLIFDYRYLQKEIFAKFKPRNSLIK